MLLLASLLEHIDRKKLLHLQQLLLESDLTDNGWDFNLSTAGLEVTNDEMPGNVALGPLEYGSCNGATNAERIADLVRYYNDVGIPTVTAIIHKFNLYSTRKHGSDYSRSTIIFPTASDAFRGAMKYEGKTDPLELLDGRFEELVNTLMTAKKYA